MYLATPSKVNLLTRICQALDRWWRSHAEVETGIQVPALRRSCPIYMTMHCVSLDGWRCDCGWPIAETEGHFV